MTVLFQDCQDLVRRHTAATWGGVGGGSPAPCASAFVGQKRRSGPHQPHLSIRDTLWRCPGPACPFPTTTVVPSRQSWGVGTSPPPGNFWPCLEAGLVVTTLGALLRPLLNILWRIGRPHPQSDSPICHQCRGREPLLWLEDCGVLAGPSLQDFLPAGLHG